MRDTIMDAGRAMVQARGYSALSFRDLAAAVGIKSASVHYHFPTKSDLAAALAGRYVDDTAARLEALLTASDDRRARLEAYVEGFRVALRHDNRMCLYSVLTAERGGLAAEVTAELDRFADVNIDWLSRVMSPADPEMAHRRALGIFAAIEGAQLVARAHDDMALFDQAIEAYWAADLFA